MYATLSLFLLLLPISANGEGKFNYDVNDAELGPSNWGNLPIEGNVCNGTRQSGIDVPTSPCDMTASYTFTAGTCTTSDLKFSINDHVVQVTFDTTISNCTPPSMVIPTFDTVFDVLQYHIHAGTDHTFDGDSFDADLHIVHKDRNGDGLSVLGMFLAGTSSEDTGLFDVLIAGLEDVDEATTKKCTNSTDGTATQGTRGRRRALSARSLQDVYNPYLKVPANATMYNYAGSLTTPPCLEIVTWNVIDVPVSISMAEVETILDLIAEYVDPETCQPASVISPTGYTARPVQPLNGREITHFCPVAVEEAPVTAPVAGPVAAPNRAPTASTSSACGAPFAIMAAALTFFTSMMM